MRRACNDGGKAIAYKNTMLAVGKHGRIACYLLRSLLKFTRSWRIRNSDACEILRADRIAQAADFVAAPDYRCRNAILTMQPQQAEFSLADQSLRIDCMRIAVRKITAFHCGVVTDRTRIDAKKSMESRLVRQQVQASRPHRDTDTGIGENIAEAAMHARRNIQPCCRSPAHGRNIGIQLRARFILLLLAPALRLVLSQQAVQMVLCPLASRARPQATNIQAVAFMCAVGTMRLLECADVQPTRIRMIRGADIGRRQRGIPRGIELLTEAPTEQRHPFIAMHCVLLRIAHAAGIKTVIPLEEHRIVFDF